MFKLLKDAQAILKRTMNCSIARGLAQICGDNSEALLLHENTPLPNEDRTAAEAT